MHDTYRFVFFCKIVMTVARPITKGVRTGVSKLLHLCLTTMRCHARVLKIKRGGLSSLNCSAYELLKRWVSEDTKPKHSNADVAIDWRNQHETCMAETKPPCDDGMLSFINVCTQNICSMCLCYCLYFHFTSASFFQMFHLTFRKRERPPINASILIFFLFLFWVEFWCVHTHLKTSFSQLLHPLPLPSRPPDRRRRDLFGVANSTHSRRNRLHTNSSTAPPLLPAGNSSTTEVEPADREFEFMEQAVTERELQISGLQPFTVYRIDVHACNRQVQRCSAAEFVFSRTKPAG